MLRRDNSRGSTKSRLGASQLDISGLDIPLALESKKRVRKPANDPRPKHHCSRIAQSK